jgi:cold shock CspA family protein/ribosome-associated translation inhibitor RaiA
MQLPVQITFRNVDRSEAIEQKILERAAKLDTYYDRITSCRVTVETPHRHHHQGALFHVRVDLVLPGTELVVNRAPQEHHAHEDPFVAVRDAFDAARRQLEDFAHRQRADVKLHDETPQGRISKLFPDYGFITTADGRDVYFHRNSVLGDGFETLALGSAVRFVEEQGHEGPQASTVHPVESRP